MAQEHIYKDVEKIVFGFLSPIDIKKMAVAKIVTPELYDKEGYPVDGGLMDIRLGVIDPGLRCKTCGSKLKECVGHFGFIDLARPVIHLYGNDVIHYFLTSTCRECNKILIEQEEIDKYKQKIERIVAEKGADAKKKYLKEIISKLKGVKKCPHCGAKQFKIAIEKPTTFIENDKRIFPIEIKSRLEKISDEDVEFLGLNPKSCRPEWLILTLMLIPPVTIRPSITLESGERSEDDLTHKLGDIVRINQRLFENINAGAPEIIVEDLWDLLQYHVTTFFDNTTSAVPPARHRSGEPLKTICERIKSKEGRFRHNLIGKRVNYSARTLISPDPHINLNEVGVPLIVAMELTVPERVTEWNIERLKEFIKRGPNLYPGANYVIRPDGKKKKITEETKEQLLKELQLGFIVERHLMDDDISIFNRQPSLHRMSIMCHRVKVFPGKSFRLHPSVCVAPDTLVQLSSGVQRPIDELKNCWKESELATYDADKDVVTKTELKKFWGLKPEEYNTRCYKIITGIGRTITATADHPFYTKDSVKKVSELSEKDFLITRPLDTPIYEEKNEILVNEENILKNSPKETYIKHTLKVLKELKLIPFNLMDQRAMIIARLLGHLYGDGTFILKKDTARMIFRGSKKDLENIQRDVESLGFKPEKIYIKTVNNKIETIKGKILEVRGSGYDFEVRNKPLCIFFSVLGAPNGDKVKLNYGVPEWIMKSPKYIQREFLASYFGCEMTKPRLRKNSKSNFSSFVLKISKIEQNLGAGKRFLENIKSILKSFDIKLSLDKVQEGNKRKDGNLTKVFVASINDEISKINLLGKIGFIYDYKKDNIARIAYYYMLLKQKNIYKRNKKYKLFKELRSKNYKFKEISAKLGMSIGSLEDWAYNVKKARLANSFISFKDWCEENANINRGFVYEKIHSIQENYVPFVYDVTTTEQTHNFFANCFLTKNCSPYNADFDGDEMNLHIPQNEEARAEAEILMQVETQIITPKNGLNIIAAIQDSITGNFLLTREMEFTRKDAISLLLSAAIEDVSRLAKTKNVNGKQVFSALLPEDFSFIGYSKLCRKCEKCKKEKCDIDAYVSIKNGNLISGIIDRASIGKEAGGLLRNLYVKYGPLFTLDLLGRISRLGIKVLLHRGFTTGLTDTDLDQESLNDIDAIIKDAEVKVDELIQEYKDGKLETYPSKTLKETLELKIQMVLNKIRNRVGEIVLAKVSTTNPILIMAHSGAQGNPLQLAQTAAVVGQQVLRGERINKGYDKRTLSLFKKDDLKPDPHGFIKSSYKHGLNPYEYFFHAMTGRDSLMDTALRTPKSGYLYRRLANALQDLRIEYDRTVRAADKKLIQFIYGDDNIDVSRSEGGTINVKKIVREVSEGV